MKRKRPLLPYLDRGRKRVARRKTIADPPDRRVDQVEIPKLKPKDLRARRSDFGTDPRVRAVDLQFTRWAGKPSQPTSEGGNYPGISQVVLRKEPEFGAVALDDAESLIIDSALKASPGWASEFVIMWYKRKLTTEEIAVKLEMKRREYVYDERERVLFYWFGRLTEIGFSLSVDPS